MTPANACHPGLPAALLPKAATLLAIAACALVSHPSQAGVRATLVDRPDTTASNAHYPGNRAPLAPSPLLRLPIGSVRPEGWVHRVLELQSAGFHGHLTEISDFLKKENNGWLNTGKKERGWEEPPYWLKGFQDCAFLLQNEAQMKEARLWIEAALAGQKPDGWIGPGEERTGVATDLKGRDDLWPNMVMLFCLQSFYDQTHDPRVLPAMTRYFRYLEKVPEDKFLVGYWPSMRGGDQLYSIYWLYNRTGEPWLLELAQKTHRRTARWDKDVIDWHNVNLTQGFREGTLYGMQSLDRNDLQAADRNWLKIRQLYGQVPGGMFGGDENCRTNHYGPRQAIETCGIAEEMLSDELLLTVNGDTMWADRCEDAAFNSMPASMTADLKALRYLTAPNQPQSDHVSKEPGIQNGGPMYCMNPHDHRCCQHNAGHAWPYFAQHLWYATADNGVAAVLYAPSTVTAFVGNPTGTTRPNPVTLRLDTRYPFEETVKITVVTGAGRFPVYLRIPGWCDRADVRVNRRKTATGTSGRYVRLEHDWTPGQTIEVTFPMPVQLRTWANNHGNVSVDRGPLTYSLKIKERYVRHGGTDTWPAWDIFPDSPWNYGLVLSSKPAKGFKIVKAPWPADDQPFAVDSAPIQLKTKARRLPGWTLDAKGLVTDILSNPVATSEPVEEVTLIPMGAARLRISAFPVAGDGR